MQDLKKNFSGTSGKWHDKIAEDSPFPPEAGRYHLYIGLFCPFAQRVNIVRYIKGLTDMIDVSVVKPYPKGDDKGWPGWRFPANENEYEGATVDKLFGSEYMHDIYFKADKDYSGRYSVPVMWDTKTNTIINNESAELLRSLPNSFNSMLSPELAAIDLYPEHLRTSIDEISEWVQQYLNRGVYMAGFSPDQDSYNENVLPVFAALNKLEKIVAKHGGPYILGKDLTELDIRVYVTAIRFDTVYVEHFRTNLGTIRHDYPVLNNWLKNLYWNVHGFKETTNFKHIKENYTKSHPSNNPKGITPMGPYPHVESGVEDFARLKAGGVQLPIVLELEAKLPTKL